MYEKNQKLQVKIDRQKISLQKHQELLEKTMQEKAKLQNKVDKLYDKQSNKSEKSNMSMTEKQLTVKEIEQKINTISILIKKDEKQFNRKKNKIQAKIADKTKEKQLMSLKLREKEQERRLGNLKLKELKRIIKQHKLKPMLNQNLKKSGRNKSLIVNQSHPAISKTYDLQYGNIESAKMISNESDINIDNYKPPKLKLAKLELKNQQSKINLNESSVDLRKKTPKKDKSFKIKRVRNEFNNYEENKYNSNTDEIKKSEEPGKDLHTIKVKKNRNTPKSKIFYSF